jgi:glutathione S-transferase
VALTLFELAGKDDRRYSLFSWRSRLALAHKELPVEYRGVRVSDKASIAFSGQDKVPILVDGEETVSDSLRIAEYLEGRYPASASLFGGAIGHGLTRQFNAWVDRVLIPAAAPLIVCDVVKHVDAEDAAYLRRGMEGAFRTTFERMAIERAERAPHFRRLLDPVRHTLRSQPFVCGAAPAYADYILFSIFQWGRMLTVFELLEPDDRLVEWRDRILDLHGGAARRAAGEGASPCRQ